MATRHNLKCKRCGKRATIAEVCPDSADEYFCSQKCIDEGNAKKGGRTYRLLGVFALNEDGSTGKMINGIGMTTQKDKLTFGKEQSYGGKEALVKQTTREKVEAWLESKPRELIFSNGINVEEISSSELVVGQLTPIIVKDGFRITMEFKSAAWEEDD